jgi:Flp pilus assembly protein TadD
MGLTFYFPHFYRRIAAALCLLGLVIVILNIFHSQIFGVNEERQLNLDILSSPGDSSLHEKLAQYYLTRNGEEARKEFALAQDLYQDINTAQSNIAGAKSSPWQTWLSLISFREKISGEIKYWEAVRARLPDYQYANLKLITLYYQLGDKDKTRQYLQSVLEEDSTNPTVLDLGEKLK